MSDTFDDGDMPDDPFEGQMPPHIRAEADLLTERITAFKDGCRKIGLYVEGEQIVVAPDQHGQPHVSLIVGFTVGNVAFSDRVQRPEQAAIDTTVKKMGIGMKADGLLDERARIERLLAEGKTLTEIMAEDPDESPES